jgi:hypothetical protein
MPGGDDRLIRAIDQLNAQMAKLATEVAKATKAQAPRPGQRPAGAGGGAAARYAERAGSGIARLARGGLFALIAGTGLAATRSLRNPELGFGTAAADLAGGAAALVGPGAQQRASSARAEQRANVFAEQLGRAGRVISEEEAGYWYRMHREPELRAVQARDRIAAIAARDRAEAVKKGVGAAGGVAEAAASGLGLLDPSIPAPVINLLQRIANAVERTARGQ